MRSFGSRITRAVLGTAGAVALAGAAHAKAVPSYLNHVSDSGVELKFASNDASGSIVVEWGVVSVTENVVTADSCNAHPDCAVYSEDFESNVDPYYIFELTGLTPSTLYQYRVTANGASTNGIETFSTAPVKGSQAPFTFVAFGDNRNGHSKHRQVVEQVLGNLPDFVINTGDHINYDEDPIFGEDTFSQWFTFFDIEAYPTSTASKGYPLLKRAPAFNSRGNHDDDTDFFLKIFRMKPSNPDPVLDDGYFSFNYGNAHFLCIDSNNVDADQIAFIDADLAAASADPDIGPMFAFYHHGAHSNGVHGGSSKTLNPDVAGAFQFYGVDVAFQGHDHLYTRYEPINGVHYVVTGGGGAPLYPANNSNQMPIAFTKSIHHHVEVTVSGNSITMNAIDKNGNLLDSTSIDASANGGVPKDFDLGLPGDGVGCSVHAEGGPGAAIAALLPLAVPIAGRSLRRRRR